MTTVEVRHMVIVEAQLRRIADTLESLSKNILILTQGNTKDNRATDRCA